MVMTYKNFINGKWVASDSGKVFESLNPADESVVGHFQASTRADVRHAIASASTVFSSWKDTPVPSRAKYLWRMRDLLIKNKERLACLIVLEMGKVIAEARGDVHEAIDVFEYMAAEGRRF